MDQEDPTLLLDKVSTLKLVRMRMHSPMMTRNSSQLEIMNPLIFHEEQVKLFLFAL